MRINNLDTSDISGTLSSRHTAPLHKEDDKMKAYNYVKHVFEREIRSQISQFKEKHELQNPSEH